MAEDGSTEPTSQFDTRRVVPAQVIAACLALAAFAVAIISGLSADVTATSVLVRAVVSMLICYPVGLVIGMVCQRILGEHLESHQLEHPLPLDDDDQLRDGAEGSSSNTEDEEVLTG